MKATNAQHVERARTIIEAMGCEVATPDDARELLNLEPRSMAAVPVAVADAPAPSAASEPVIGGGWAAYFLARGYDVVAWDPAPDAETRLRHLVDAAWPALTQLGLAEGADPARLRFEPELDKALAGAEFVQESAPEDLELKRRLADIDAAAPSRASSSPRRPRATA